MSPRVPRGATPSPGPSPAAVAPPPSPTRARARRGATRPRAGAASRGGRRGRRPPRPSGRRRRRSPICRTPGWWPSRATAPRRTPRRPGRPSPPVPGGSALASRSCSRSGGPPPRALPGRMAGGDAARSLAWRIVRRQGAHGAPGMCVLPPPTSPTGTRPRGGRGGRGTAAAAPEGVGPGDRPPVVAVGRLGPRQGALPGRLRLPGARPHARPRGARRGTRPAWACHACPTRPVAGTPGGHLRPAAATRAARDPGPGDTGPRPLAGEAVAGCRADTAPDALAGRDAPGGHVAGRVVGRAPAIEGPPRRLAGGPGPRGGGGPPDGPRGLARPWPAAASVAATRSSGMSRRMAGPTVALGRATIAGTRERGPPMGSPPGAWAGSRRGDCGPRACRRRWRGRPPRGPGRARRARRSRGRRPRGRGPARPTSPPATRRGRGARPGGTPSPRSRRGAPSSRAPRTCCGRRGRCARSRRAASRRARPRTRRTEPGRGGFPRRKPTAFPTDPLSFPEWGSRNLSPRRQRALVCENSRDSAAFPKGIRPASVASPGTTARGTPPTGPRIPASPSQRRPALSHPVATQRRDLDRGARARASRARGPCPRPRQRGCRRRPAWSPAPSRARGGHRRATASAPAPAPARARGPSRSTRRRPLPRRACRRSASPYGAASPEPRGRRGAPRGPIP